MSSLLTSAEQLLVNNSNSHQHHRELLSRKLHNNNNNKNNNFQCEHPKFVYNHDHHEQQNNPLHQHQLLIEQHYNPGLQQEQDREQDQSVKTSGNLIMANINDSHLSRNSPSYYQGQPDNRFLLQQQTTIGTKQSQQLLPSSSSSSSMDHRMTSSGYNNAQISSLDNSSYPRQASNLLHHSQDQQHRFNNQHLLSHDQEYIQRDPSNDNGVCFMDFSNTTSQTSNNSNFTEPDLNSIVPLHDAATTIISEKPLKTRNNMNLNIANTTSSAHSNCCSDGTNSVDSNNIIINNNAPYPPTFNDQQQQSRHSLIFQQDHQQQHQYAQQHPNTHNQQVVHMGQQSYNQPHGLASSHHSHHLHQPNQYNHQQLHQQQFHHQQSHQKQLFPSSRDFNQIANNPNQKSHHISAGRQQALSSPNHQNLQQQLQHIRANQQQERYGNIIPTATMKIETCHHQARDRGESWLSNFPMGNDKQFGLNGKPTPIELMKNEIYEQLHKLLNIVYTYENLVLQSNCKQEEVACSMTNAGNLHKALRQNQERYKLGEINLEILDHSKREVENEQTLFRLAVSQVNEFRRQLLKNHYQIFRELSEIKEKVFAQLNHWIQEQQQGSTNAVYHSVSSSAPSCSSSIIVKSSTSMTNTTSSSSGIGAQPTNSDYQTYALDLIENQIQMIVDVVNETKSQLGRGAQKWSEEKWDRCDEGIKERGSILLQKYDRFLEDVIVKSFIVEKQPPQVMKTNTRFSSTCRFLCGNRINILLSNPPQVKVSIISENTAKTLMERRNDLLKTSWSSMGQNSDLDDNELIRLFSASAASTSPGPVYSPSSVPQNLSSPRSNASSTQAIDNQQLQAARSSSACQQQQHYGVPLSNVNYHNHLNDISSNRNLKVIDVSRLENCGEIINNTNLMEFNESTRHVSCNFRNMQLKKIKRTEKKGTESVMDEKSILLFSAEFRTPISANMDNYYQIMAFSLPVVVIVHGNQESHAWATVTWHNAFARPTEYLYDVPDKVQWHELGQVLSEKFKSCTGRGLNSENLEFLATKICRSAQINNTNAEVNWAQFAKELLPDRSFTFWEWFYSMFKLTREHLRELWGNNKIYGFIGKSGCIKLLSDRTMKIGTFLLRFSEHELGGVTIAYISSGDSTNNNIIYERPLLGTMNANNMDNQSQSPTYGVTPEGNHICFVHPFVHKDLNTRSLADRIRDLSQLLYLYPNISKGEAFEKFYTPIYDNVETPEGYIKPMLVQLLMKDYPKNESTTNTTKINIDSSIASKSGEGGVDNLVEPETPNSPRNVYKTNNTGNNIHDNYTTDMDLSYNDDDDHDDNDDDLS